MALTLARKKATQQDDGKAVAHAPSVRVLTRWTFDMLRSAELQAEGGQLRMAAQVCEWLLTDDRISGALTARSDALLGLEPSFEASGDKRRSKRVVKALEAGEDWFEAYPESELDQFNIWGVLLGVAPGIHRWSENEDHGNRVLPYPEFWHPETLQQDQRTLVWSVGDSLGARHIVTPGDGTWLMHMPFGKNRPWSRGLWRSLKNWALLKSLAMTDYSVAGEKSRTVVGTSPEGSTYDQRQKLADEIMASGSDAVILLAYGYDLKALQLSANTKDIYDAQIALANAAFAIRIRGGNLTTEVKGDGATRAATETQARTGDQPKLARDAGALSTTLHGQSLSWWAEFNFGDRKLAPWPVWPIEPGEDLKAKSETEGKALENAEKAELLGFEVDRKAFLEEYGFTWAKPGTPKAIPAPAPAPAPGVPVPAPAPRPAPSASNSFRLRLASGAAAGANTGFVNGQLYTDAVVVDATDEAKDPLEEIQAAIREELDASGDYDEFIARMTARYADMDPDDLNTIVYAATALAQLAGRVAVQEDVDP